MSDFKEVSGLLLQLLDTYGSRRDRKAGKNMYTCPLCHSGEHGAGSTGALNVGSKDGVMLFYCHSCGVGGNIATLWCEYHNEPSTPQNFPNIMRGIRQDLGLPTDEYDYDRFKKNYTFKGDIDQNDLTFNNCDVKSNKDYSTWFENYLWGYQSYAVEYLQSRGIQNAQQIAAEYRIGYSPNFKYNGTDEVKATIIPMPNCYDDHPYASIFSYSWRATEQNLKKKKGRVYPLVPECLRGHRDPTKKVIFLVEGEYDAFSIVDIQHSIENSGQTCEFTAISAGSVSNFPRFVQELYESGIITSEDTLLLVPDNDPTHNPNVEYFGWKSWQTALTIGARCFLTSLTSSDTPLKDCKDANETLRKDRAAFEKILKNVAERHKSMFVDNFDEARHEYLDAIESVLKDLEKEKKGTPDRLERETYTVVSTSDQEVQQATSFSLKDILESIDTLTYEDFCNGSQKLTSIVNIVGTLQSVEDVNTITSSLVNVAERYKKKTDVEKLLKSKVSQAKKRITQGQKVTNGKYPDYVKVGDNGKPYQTIENCLNVLQHDEMYKGRITFNEFSNKVMYDGKQWKDENFSQLVCYMESAYNLTQEKKIRHAFILENKRNTFHPIRDYLNGLTWDGVPRISTIFTDFLGADDNKYTRAVAMVTLCGAVARALSPGIKFDTMAVLVGKQGIGKSTFWAKLGGEWFSDTLDAIKGKEAYESIQSSWIVEIAELSAMARATKEDTKKFITKTSDKYRKPYAENVEEIPRQCIFVGTTNDYEFLKDETGNRRFYPIDVYVEEPAKSIWNELTQEYIDQVWAEAKGIYLKHGTDAIYIKDKEILQLASYQQLEHFGKSTTYSEVEAYLTMPVPPTWDEFSLEQRHDFINRYRRDINVYASEIRKIICIREILADLYPEDYPMSKKIPLKVSYEIAKILSSLGWEQSCRCRTKLFGRQRMFTCPKDSFEK